MCVLLVDDEQMLREIVSEYLADRGLTVVTACDGSEAFELIDHPPQRFTILLADFNMPGPHNGCAVAHRMRAVHPHVHLSIVTGRPDLLEDACGADLDYEVIAKPFELGRIAEHLARL